MSDSSPPRKRRTAGRITLNDVAREVGVSALTVSRFFNHPERVSEELRQRIGEAVSALGYVQSGRRQPRFRAQPYRRHGHPEYFGPIFANTIQASATP